MKEFGWALFVAGVGLVVWGIAFDPSVATYSVSGYLSGPDRVVNIGQVATKLVIFMTGGLSVLAGAIFVAAMTVVEALKPAVSADTAAPSSAVLIDIDAAHDPAIQQIHEGANTIEGSVSSIFHVDTGQAVHLVKVTPFSTARAIAIYGGDGTGFRPAGSKPANFRDTPDSYANENRHVVTRGSKFLFEKVDDGEYFVTCSVVGDGLFSRRVSVAGGETNAVLLTRS